MLFVACFSALLFALSKDHVVAIFQPKGVIAMAERNLIFTAFALMLIVVVPVYILTLFIALRYRAGNTKAKYTPTRDRDLLEEFIWWAIPCVIVSALAIVTWKSSHQLDPFQPLESANTPMTIEVVALNWKWLFIYPKEGIASVNFVEFPENTSVDFKITSGAAMNSFWIPQLGGQIYAMSGMVTHLHLDGEAGEYAGASANLSGRGFSGMHFVAKVVSRPEFDAWVSSIQLVAPSILDSYSFHELQKESVDEPVSTFRLSEYPVFDSVLDSYMAPGTMHTMNMNI